MTSFVTTPGEYGRVIEDGNGVRIVEYKDCTKQERLVNKINAGIYLFSRKFLEKHINSLEQKNGANEFYLTDLIKIANDEGATANLISRSYDEVRGVNNLEELWAVEQIKRSEVMRKLMLNGVRFELAQTIHIDVDIEIGNGSFIGNSVLLLGKTKVGKNSKVLACSTIEDCNIGNNTIIHSHSIVRRSTVGNNCEVGPFANVRDHSVLQDNVKVGNFAEIKRSTLCTGSASKHLVYLGDTEVCSRSRVGVGTVTCNYDGIKKNRTVIGKNSTIGGHTTLIAPTVIPHNTNVTSGLTTSGKNTKKKDIKTKEKQIAV